MRLNVLFRDNSNEFNVASSADNDSLDVGFGTIQRVTESDYDDTTENWDAQQGLVTEEAAIYIYSDYQIYEDEAENQTVIAGLKIGDGSSYLIDMPFVTDGMSETLIKHLADDVVHITAAEREFWNNKVSAYIDHTNEELLVLSKKTYEDENGDIQNI